ncbi:hypothetical protein [Primorskyibacter flagellatus]|uniref:hypothetical protein n=1 Tax=Primorskyibacter flagellatus TaxID=1387277 RepID=UPI003A958B5F
MIDDTFRQTGWQIRRFDAPITRFQVFGERSSGTNFVNRLIGRHTGLTPIEDLGWKHGFPHMTAIPRDVAVICVVRNAVDWARSMFAKPWHCTPAMQSLPFDAFIRAEWDTIADRPRYFPQVQALGGAGAPLQLDRHPLTGRRFANIFDLRRHKLEGLLGLAERECCVVFVRLESAQAAPEAFLSDLCAGLHLPVPDAPFRPVNKRLGSRFKPAVPSRPDLPNRMSAGDRAFMLSCLDTVMESGLGYDYAI